MNRIKILKDIYSILSNSFFLLAVVVLSSHVFLSWWYWSPATPNYYEKLSGVEKSAYSHMSPDQINRLLAATWDAQGGWQYQEWVGFREKERESDFVNVNEFGIRSNKKEQVKMEDLNGAIWFFGGSTTFGYGVADNETIPALLEGKINSRVINFGRGYYYSAQENFLFKELLKGEYKPKWVIFLDGINERCDIGTYQRSLGELFKIAQKGYFWNPSETVKPPLYLLRKVINKLNISSPNESKLDVKQLHNTRCSVYGKNVMLKDVLLHNLNERRAICDKYKLTCATFVQPFAGLHGTHEDYAGLSKTDREKLAKKYEELEPIWKTFGANFLTSSLDDFKGHAFVDNVHYSSSANSVIAEAIVEFIQ